MKNLTLNEAQNKNTSKFSYGNLRSMFIMYLDIIFRGLIALLCIGIPLSILLVGYLHVKSIYAFLIIFTLSIMLTPYLSRIQISEKIITKYEQMLRGKS